MTTVTTRRPRRPRHGRRPRPGPAVRDVPAANEAGYGPYRSGVDAEYDWYRDRDHDGVVCER